MTSATSTFPCDKCWMISAVETAEATGSSRCRELFRAAANRRQSIGEPRPSRTRMQSRAGPRRTAAVLLLDVGVFMLTAAKPLTNSDLPSRAFPRYPKAMRCTKHLSCNRRQLTRAPAIELLRLGQPDAIMKKTNPRLSRRTPDGPNWVKNDKW